MAPTPIWRHRSFCSMLLTHSLWRARALDWNHAACFDARRALASVRLIASVCLMRLCHRSHVLHTQGFMDYDALMHECLERESLKRPTMEDVRYRYNYHAHPFNTGFLCPCNTVAIQG